MKITRLLFTGLLIFTPLSAMANILQWSLEFPKTKFNLTSVTLSDIRSVGARRDSIPAIFNPKFIQAKSISNLGQLEPIVRVEVKGEVRGYPLRILVWHELVNDEIRGIPILISYCPLSSSSVVFDRRLKNRTLGFANTGLLRHYDTIIYDTSTESWFQLYTGDAIVGSLTGKRLKPIASRIQSFGQFKAAFPEAKVLVPNNLKAQNYGHTPYVRLDSRNDTASQFPYLIPGGVGPLDRVVVIGNESWPLKKLKEVRRIEAPGLVISWSPGMNSVQDTRWIPFGRDIGNVRVQYKSAKGWIDTIHNTTFAFSFAAFHPNGIWHFK
jgi:hypothetical protein